MLLKSSLTALAALACAAVLPIAAPANAEIIRVTGSGSFDSVRFSRGATSTLQIGTPVSVGFSFDTEQLTVFSSGADSIIYRFTALDFSANVGGHIFQLNNAPNTSSLLLNRGFALFGGPSTESALIQSFFLNGLGGSSVPFGLDGGAARDSLQLTSFFNFGTAEIPTPSIALLRDPKSAARSSFSYNAINALSTQSGSGSGPANVAFGGAVPEPTTWAMLIIGFGLIGGAMRRRTARAKVALSAA